MLQVDLCDILIEAGASVHKSGFKKGVQSGNTPLHAAAQGGHQLLVK